jgi:transcriptional regulator with XRE-family HTH domain
MYRRPSEGIGERVANYRRLAGLTAQQLSDKLGGAMTRGVIANIETGRKTDLTLDQVIALAWALDVPFVALALPLDKPFHWLTLAVGTEPMSVVSMRTSTLASWMTDKPTAFTLDTNKPGMTPAAVVARSILRSLDELWQLSHQVERTKRLAQEEPRSGHDEHLSELEDKLEAVKMSLAGLGVDLTEEPY